jgi:hypothetical protein
MLAAGDDDTRKDFRRTVKDKIALNCEQATIACAVTCGLDTLHEVSKVSVIAS